jgi:hypothetical protein
MAKQHFYFKLIPPRASFAQDMTAEEQRLMESMRDICTSIL